MSLVTELSNMREATIATFRKADATSLTTAKKLEDIYPDYKNDGSFRMGIKYLKGNGYLKRKNGLYYIDEEALARPFKTQSRRFVKLYLAVLGSMILILAAIVLIVQYSNM